MNKRLSYKLVASKSEKKSYVIKSLENNDSFYYNYTYDYEWINLKESSIAEVSFNSSDLFLLTNQNFIVRKKNIEHSFRTRKINEISIGLKRYMLPLLIGGITTPLAIVGFLKNIFSPWIGIAVIFTGILLFYYGYKGGYQLEVKTSKHTQSFFIEEMNSSIESFLKLVKEEIKKNKKSFALKNSMTTFAAR